MAAGKVDVNEFSEGAAGVDVGEGFVG